MSVSAKDKDVEIDDELARGQCEVSKIGSACDNIWHSTKCSTRSEAKDIDAVKEELSV